MIIKFENINPFSNVEDHLNRVDMKTGFGSGGQDRCAGQNEGAISLGQSSSGPEFPGMIISPLSSRPYPPVRVKW